MLFASGWRGSYCGRKEKKAVVEQVTLVEVQYEYASSTGEDEDSAEDVEDLED